MNMKLDHSYDTASRVVAALLILSLCVVQACGPAAPDLVWTPGARYVSALYDKIGTHAQYVCTPTSTGETCEVFATSAHGGVTTFARVECEGARCRTASIILSGAETR